MRTLVDLIDRLAGSSHALVLYDAAGDAAPLRVSHPELLQHALAWAAWLRTQGVGPGTRVILPFESDERIIACFLGLVGLGALPLSVKPLLAGTPADELLGLFRLLTAGHGVERIVRSPSLTGLELGAPAIELPPTSASLPRAGREAFSDASEDALAFVQFSSGSTGLPRGVPITHGKLVGNLERIASHDGRTDDDVGSSWLPLYHDMGLVGALLSYLHVRADLHLHSPSAYLLDPLGWLEEAGRVRTAATVMPSFAVDYALRAARRATPAELASLDLRSLRFVWVGAEPIDVAAIHELCDRLAPAGLRPETFVSSYGLAEAVLLVSASPAGEAPHGVEMDGGFRVACLGQPAAGFEVEFVREDGALAADGELGELRLRGGTLAASYFESEHELLDSRGFHATGDLGFRRDGRLHVSGRSGDRLKIAGQTFFSSALEAALADDPALRVGRIVVVQVDGRVHVLAEGRRRKVLAGREAIRSRLAGHLLARTGIKVAPEDVRLLERGEVETTSSGKLRRHALQARLVARTLREL